MTITSLQANSENLSKLGYLFKTFADRFFTNKLEKFVVNE